MGKGIFSDDHIRTLLSSRPEPRPAPPAAMPAGDAAPTTMSFEGCSPESRKFLAAWQSWRGTQLLPRRQQVDLTSIARLMPQLAVLEVHGPDRATFRLAGTEIENQYGARLTGRSYIALTDPAKQQKRGELLWLHVKQPCAVIAHQELEFRSGRRCVVEIASAPVLPDSEDQPVRVFAVVSRFPRQPLRSDGERDMVVRNFGRNLRLIDIGAGIPGI